MTPRHVFQLTLDAQVQVSGGGLDMAEIERLLHPYVQRRVHDDDIASDPPTSVCFEASEAPRNSTRLLSVSEDFPRSIRVRLTRREEQDRLFAFQLVRGVLVDAALRSHAPLHAAVVARGGVGIVFTGKKGAGKTSMVTAFLRRASDFAFVSNDKSLVSPVEGHVIGLPYAVSVGTAGLRMTPELSEVFTRSSGEKELVWPADFAHALSSRLDRSCRVALVVVCEADFSARDLRATNDVSRGERREHLSTCMADFGEAMLPEYLVGVPGVRSTTRVAPRLPEAWVDLPWLRARGNPWCEGPPILELLAAAGDPLDRTQEYR